MVELRYTDEESRIQGNESNVASFCRDFAEFEKLSALERIELLDDLVRPDLGVSEMAVFLLPQLIEVARGTDTEIRFSLFTAIGGIQRVLFCGELEREALSADLFDRVALLATRDELRRLIDYSHTPSWRQGVVEFIEELSELAATAN